MSQYDVGRPIGFVVSASGSTPDFDNYTVTLEGTRSDGTPVTAPVTTDGNICALETTATMTNKTDRYPASIVVTDGNGNRIASIPVTMMVVKAAMDENAEGVEEDRSLYQQYTGTVQSLIADIRTQLGAEASARQVADNQLQSNINAEASTRATQDASLQSQINQLIAPSGEAPSAAEVENARVGADGTVYPTLGDAIRTQVTDVKSALEGVSERTENLIIAEAADIRFDGGALAYFSWQHAFSEIIGPGTYTLTILATSDNPDIDYVYVSGYKGSAVNVENRLFIKGAKKGELSKITFTIADELDMLYIAAKNPPSESGGLTVAVNSIRLNVGDEITPIESPYSAIDYKARVMVERNTDELTNLERVVKGIDQINILPVIAAEGWFIDYSTGEPKGSDGRGYTDFVDVGPYKKIIYRQITTTNSTGVVGMAWYNKERQYISGIRCIRNYTSNGYIDSEVDVPENAYYARFSTFSDVETYGEFFVKPKNSILEIIPKILVDEIITYNNFKTGYIDTSGTQVDLDNPVQDNNFNYVVIPCIVGDVLSPNTLGGNAGRVRCAFCDSQGNILWKSGTAAEASTAPANRYIRWLYTAPAGTSYAVVNHHIVSEAGFSPIVYKCYSDEKLNLYASKKGEIPYLPAEEWRRCVIATYNNYIAIKMDGNIRISDDCGETWSNDIYAGDIASINNAHFYANGTLAFFTDTKAYYIADKSTINEADVFEADGVTPFVLDTDSNFNAGRDHAERKFINGNDMYVFNNYHMVEGTGRPVVWYSIDNGRSYKVACEFNTQDTFTVRHFHDVIYWKEYDKFILTTGDRNTSECYVCELTYDANNDTWSVQKLAGSSRNYKWAGLALWNNELYYTHDSTPGSVWKCSYENIADLTKHVCVLDYTENDCNNVWFGANGDMIVTQSTARSTGGATVPTPYTASEACRKAYYSTNGKNFDALFLPNEFFNRSSLLRSPKPLTSDGHLYFSSFYGDDGLPSVCIDDYVRIYLNKQAFKPKI
jgi:hypothetical protein